MLFQHDARERKIYTSIVCALLLFTFTGQQTAACSWDYAIWMIRSKDADPLYRFLKDGKAGYINGHGKIVIKPSLNGYSNYGDEFHDGLLALGVADGPYVDTSGKIALDKGYYRSWDFSDGLAVAARQQGEKWGYIDRTGEFVISPRFDSYPNGRVSSFSDGMAMIEVGEKVGYIDRSGGFVIQPKFVFGADFKDGMARVVIEGPCVYWDDSPCGGAVTVSGGSQVSRSACKFTFIDKSGSAIPNGNYDGAKDFSEGLAAVLVGNAWGYVDKKGRMIIEPQFDDAEPFSDGMARVKRGELWGYVDMSGRLAIATQFEDAYDFSDGLAPVGKSGVGESESGEYYFINKRGVEAFIGKFAAASHFYKGLAHVKLKTRKQVCPDDQMSQEGAFAYIDVTGRRIFTYQNCEPEED